MKNIDALDIRMGPTVKGLQFFVFVGRDSAGETLALNFACQQNYAEGARKMLSRLKPIKIKPAADSGKADEHKQ